MAHERLTLQRAHGLLAADSLDENVRAVADGLLEVLDGVAADGPTEEELRRDAAEMRARLDDPDDARGRLAYAASMELFGAPFETEEELLRARSAVTAGDAAAAVAAALESLLLLVPAGTPPPRRGLPEMEMRSPHAIDGRRYRPRSRLPFGGSRDAWIVAGEHGIAFETAEMRATVRFETCEALLRWEDGRRALWSDDGWYVAIDPSVWRRGDQLVALVDRSVASDRVVPMERERAERAAAVASVLGEKVSRGLDSSELEVLLPDVLERGEMLVTAANAQLGWKTGLLAATDRRLLFVHLRGVEAEVELADVRGVGTREGSAFREDALLVQTPDGVLEFKTIRPKERRPELVEHLGGRGDDAAPPAG